VYFYQLVEITTKMSEETKSSSSLKSTILAKSGCKNKHKHPKSCGCRNQEEIVLVLNPATCPTESHGESCECDGCKHKRHRNKCKRVGPMGMPGPQGPAGPAGTNGTNGTDGTDGEPGPQGPAGPAGTNGTNGTNGTDGTNGTNGTDGEPGPQGPAGPAGANGTNGTDGTNGTNGTNGTDGEPGPQGPAGPAGPAGTNGTNGTNGINGTDGKPGPQGPAGPAGPKGKKGDTVVGPQGPIGAQGPAGIVPNTPCNKRAIQNWNTTYSATANSLQTFDVIFPGQTDPTDMMQPNVLTYLNLNVHGPSSLINANNGVSLFGGFCFDIPNPIDTTQSYTYQMLSMLDPQAWSIFSTLYQSFGSLRPINMANGPTSNYPFYAILSLMNNFAQYQSQVHFSGNMQTAMWTILFQNIAQGTTNYIGSLYTDDTAIYDYTQTYGMINDALTNTQSITASNAYTILTQGNMLIGNLMLSPAESSLDILMLWNYICDCGCEGDAIPAECDGLDDWNAVYSSTNNVQETFKVAAPGSVDPAKNAPNIPTFLNTTINPADSTSYALSGLFGSWCTDNIDTINPGQPYQGTLVSALDPQAWNLFVQTYAAMNPTQSYNTANPTNPAYPLYAILWILNHYKDFINLQTTQSFVNNTQVAIWTLLYQQIGQGQYTALNPYPSTGPFTEDTVAPPAYDAIVTAQIITAGLIGTAGINPSNASTILTDGSNILANLMIPGYVYPPPGNKPKYQIFILVNTVCCDTCSSGNVGPAGQPGPQGPAGVSIQGPQGPSGANGTNGEPGVPGPQGPQGPRGRDSLVAALFPLNYDPISQTASVISATGPLPTQQSQFLRGDLIWSNLPTSTASLISLRIVTVGIDAPTINGCIALCTAPSNSNTWIVRIPPGVYTENLNLTGSIELQGMSNPNDSITVQIIGQHTCTGSNANPLSNRISISNILFTNSDNIVPTFALTATTAMEITINGCFLQHLSTALTAVTLSVGNLVTVFINDCKLRMPNGGVGGCHAVLAQTGASLYSQFGLDVNGGTQFLKADTGGYAQLTGAGVIVNGNKIISLGDGSSGATLSANGCTFQNLATVCSGVILSGLGQSSCNSVGNTWLLAAPAGILAPKNYIVEGPGNYRYCNESYGIPGTNSNNIQSSFLLATLLNGLPFPI